SPFAYAAIQKAVSLAPARATPVERALIDAMAWRYVATFDPAKRVDQDRAYAAAMKIVADKFPKDLDVLTLYADALFLLEPRRGDPGRQGLREADRRHDSPGAHARPIRPVRRNCGRDPAPRPAGVGRHLGLRAGIRGPAARPARRRKRVAREGPVGGGDLEGV